MQSVDHLRTVIGVVVCTIGVIIATPIVRFFAIFIWGVQDSWLPAPVAYYVIRAPTEFMMSVAGGAMAIMGTHSFIRRADPAIMAYAVSTVYLCLFIALLLLIYASGQTPEDLLLNLAQMSGIVVGLALGHIEARN